MKFKLLTIIIFLGVSNTIQAAEIYKCTDKRGKMTFSQQPCSGNVEKIEVKGHEKIGSVNADSETFDGIADSNRVRDIDHEIKNRYIKLRNLKRQMNRELSTLKAKQRRARNNLAGATWEQSIATEMQAVTSRYDSAISREQDIIERLKDERNSLQP